MKEERLLAIWVCGSSEGSLENKPLAVSICIRLLVTTNVSPVVEGERQGAHQSLLYYHSLCSILEGVERDSVPFVDFHPDHQVILTMNINRRWDVLVWILIINTQVSIHIA